jgi:hypothetical protein
MNKIDYIGVRSIVKVCQFIESMSGKVQPAADMVSALSKMVTFDCLSNYLFGYLTSIF